MAIEDLTGQLTMLKEHGAPDLELSEATRDQYVALIRDYRAELQAQRQNAAGLGALFYAGDYDSAKLTRLQLESNVGAPNGILATLDAYIAYLDALEATVNAACKRLLAQG